MVAIERIGAWEVKHCLSNEPLIDRGRDHKFPPGAGFAKLLTSVYE